MRTRTRCTQEELIRKSGGKDSAFIESTRTSIVDFICDASQQSMVLPPADGFHRMLIYRELTDIFSDVLVHERASLNGEMRVRVNRTQRTSSLGATREAVEAAVHERARVVNELQLNSAVGFRHVMDLLASTHKPVVGHNMLLDMMQVEAHFHRDLPPELSKFKTSLHHRFPTLVDTKHLLAAAPQSLARHFTLGSRLDMVFKTVCGDVFKTPKVELANGFTRYLHKRHHEAGFDAYMTGVVYVRLAHELVKTVPSSSTNASPGLSRQSSGLAHTGLTPRLRDLGPAASAASQRAPAHFDTLCSHGYCNKLHVMGCGRVAFFDFDGGMEREISPLGDWPEFALSSPKRGRALSQDMDTSLEHEEALRRGPGTLQLVYCLLS
jgi:DNA polymerase III epsilon subunit-like protein